jgi:peptidoglycan/LPS O-acetylase OafA/YrhL
MVEWQSRTTHSVVGWVLDYMVSSVLCALCVGLVAARAGRLSAVFERRSVRALGQRTYAGYVFHMFAVAIAWWVVARWTRDPWVAAPLRTALALPLTFAAAHLVWITFERRLLVLKDRFQPMRAAASQAGG